MCAQWLPCSQNCAQFCAQKLEVGHLGKTTHGMTKTAEYRVYLGAKYRCENPRDHAYPDYGGRGVKFLFVSFEQFYAELGPRPPGLSLDRIENDGHYTPGNVRWATRTEQNRNQRTSHMINIRW